MQRTFKNKKIFFVIQIALIFVFVFLFLKNISEDVPKVKASTVEELRSKIDQKSSDIKKLEAEIATYQNSLGAVSSQADSLKKELNTLNLTKKKLETDLKVTEANISKTNLGIQSLAIEIENKEDAIDQNIRTLKEVIKDIRNTNSDNPLQRILAGESISDYLETSQNFEQNISEQVDNLKLLKQDLERKKTDVEGKKKELSNLKKELSGKKEVVAETQKEKDSLLKVTKNQETNYKKIIADKTALRAQFEQELFSFESDLKIAIDPSKLPSVKNGILAWPLDKIKITQMFGKTAFSGRLYVSGTHNGVDFGASDGTPVKATLSGTVTATGNTDLKNGCYSYGKWILIRHDNGLSSLFGHLSSVLVSPGNSVSTGDTIGLSGHTGYVTGPHLHLSVLATEGLRVMQIPDSKTVSCRGITIPIADPKAFLDPMVYLPH